MRRQTLGRSISALLLAPMLLSGCDWGDDSATAGGFGAQLRDLRSSGRIANTAPNLTGIPPAQAAIDTYFEFAPAAQDADGHRLEFSITNRPAWASFDTLTGRLAGTPTAADSGVYANIVIAVTDGRASATLGPFTLAVGAGLASLPGSGTAELSWSPPTQNSDGSPVTDLAGYRIYYGTDPQTLAYNASLTGSSNTSYRVTGLHNGTWYFAVAAVTAAGVESDLSEIGSKTIG